MAPRLAVLIMAGIACLAARNMGSTLTCMTRRQVSGSSSTTDAAAADADVVVEEVEAAEAVERGLHHARAWALSVRSAWCAAAVPPSSAIMATVRSASALSRSTTSTLVPARASRMAAARPLPMPSPAAPPPAMMATLPSRPAVVLARFLGGAHDRSSLGPGTGLMLRPHAPAGIGASMPLSPRGRTPPLPPAQCSTLRAWWTGGWVPACAGMTSLRRRPQPMRRAAGRDRRASCPLGRGGSEPQPITVNSTRRSSASLASSRPVPTMFSREPTPLAASRESSSAASPCRRLRMASARSLES